VVVSKPLKHFILEGRKDKVAPLSVFARRMLTAVGLAFALVLPALLIGILGYHWIDQLDWVDSLLEASMILGGMGPVNELHSDGAKIFASVYALFSGLILIGVMGIILTPITHRVLHKFHVEK
jgi:hypothetical protein